MSECSGPGCPSCGQEGQRAAENLATMLQPPKKIDVAEVEAQITELYELRRMAKEAARSGDPAIRAEAKRGVDQCNESLTFLRGLLSKEA